MAYAEASLTVDEMNRLTEQNERLKDDLFILLQPQNQVSDASIRTDFHDLCQSIDFWVDNVIGDSILDVGSQHEGKEKHREQSLRKESGIASSTLEDHKSSPQLLLSLAIQRNLRKGIFNQAYPVGITKQQEEVINQILESMKNLETGQEQLIRDRWTSEAVRALTAHKDFKQHQADALDNVIQTAVKFISPKLGESICGLDHRAFQKHDDIFKEIFETAVKLHQSIRSSVHRYRVQRPKIDMDMDGEQMLASGWKLREVDKWMDVTRIDPPVRIICPLYPSIVREPDGHSDALTVVPPVVVVALEKSKKPVPSSRAHAAKKSPRTSISSEPPSKETAQCQNPFCGTESTDIDTASSDENSGDTDHTRALVPYNGNNFLSRLTKWARSRS